MKIKRAILASLAALLLPGVAAAEPSDIVPADGTAVFAVQKIFADRNDETAVILNFSCTSGNFTDQSRTIDPGPGQQQGSFEAIFVLYNIPDSNDVNCTITETPVGGYHAQYRCLPESDSNPDSDCVDAPTALDPGTSCQYNGVEELDVNFCEIRNIPNTAEISITKKWIVDGAGGNALRFEARINIESTAYFDGANLCNGNKFCGNVNFDDGPASETMSVTVYPTFEGDTIYVDETFQDSAFESDNDCDGTMSVMPAGYQGTSGEDSCTFTNTAYFEGVPTLNPHGMAIMALLMLGVGFIGFRRFA